MILVLYRASDGQVAHVQHIAVDHQGKPLGPEQFPPALREIYPAWEKLELKAIVFDVEARAESHEVVVDGDTLIVRPKDTMLQTPFCRDFKEIARQIFLERTRERPSHVRRHGYAPSPAVKKFMADFTQEELLRIAQDTSIIVTCHNYARWLPECLDSILKQTMQPREIICVDDASADDSAAVMEKYAAAHAIVRWKRVDYENVCQARNEAAKEAQGEFLLFVDADDKLDEEFLREIIVPMADLRVAVCYPNVQLFGGMDAFRRAARFDFDALTEHNYICATSLVRRCVFEEIGGFEPTLESLQDWDLWWRICKMGYWAAPTKATLFYRKHSESMSVRCRTAGDGKATKWEPYARVLRRNSDITILTAIDDKEYVQREHLQSILDFDYDRAKLNLLLMDNSTSPIVGELIREFLVSSYDAGFHSVQVIRFQSPVSIDQPILARKSEIKFEVAQRVSQIYRQALRSIGTELVLFYENDVVAPPETIGALMDAMRPRVGAVTTVCLDRRTGKMQAKKYLYNDPRRIRWGEALLQRMDLELDNIQEIGTAAWSCVLMRRSAVRQTVPRILEPICGSDGLMGWQLKQEGYSYQLAPVKARHYIDAGKYVVFGEEKDDGSK